MAAVDRSGLTPSITPQETGTGRGGVGQVRLTTVIRATRSTPTQNLLNPSATSTPVPPPTSFNQGLT